MSINTGSYTPLQILPDQIDGLPDVSRRNINEDELPGDGTHDDQHKRCIFVCEFVGCSQSQEADDRCSSALKRSLNQLLRVASILAPCIPSDASLEYL